MGWRPDGTHQFGVLLPSDGRAAKDGLIGMEVMEAVEATSWAQFVGDDGGVHLVLSNSEGKVVREFGPGEWTDVVNAVPGDQPEEE